MYKQKVNFFWNEDKTKVIAVGSATGKWEIWTEQALPDGAVFPAVINTDPATGMPIASKVNK